MRPAGETSLRCDELKPEQRTGQRDAQHCAMGVVSRDGWAVVDDLLGGRFDGASAKGGWDWATPIERAAGPEAGGGGGGGSAEEDARCGEWAATGECKNNPGFMASNCQRACARKAARDAAVAQAGERCDLYLFGHGLDFKAALRDFARLSGAQVTDLAVISADPAPPQPTD